MAVIIGITTTPVMVMVMASVTLLLVASRGFLVPAAAAVTRPAVTAAGSCCTISGPSCGTAHLLGRGGKLGLAQDQRRPRLTSGRHRSRPRTNNREPTSNIQVHWPRRFKQGINDFSFRVSRMTSRRTNCGFLGGFGQRIPPAGHLLLFSGLDC